MAGTHLTVSVAPQNGAQQPPDPASLMPRIGEYLQRTTEARFKTQTAPDGTPWKELQPSYAQRKKYHKDKVLTLRGYLRRSIRYQVTDPSTVEVGTNVEYAAIHQLGGSITQNAQSRLQRYRSVAGRVLFAANKHKRGVTQRWVTRGAYQVDLPARPFLGLSAVDEQALGGIIKDWAQGK